MITMFKAYYILQAMRQLFTQTYYEDKPSSWDFSTDYNIKKNTDNIEASWE
jgi:hypothetical protein